ncbi:hypothetical protein [Filifactor alocis]
MSRLPILQELFQSKDIFLFVIGIGVSVVFSYFWKQLKWCLIGTFVSFGIYLFCEMTAPKVVSYAEAFGILFLGWFCLGSTFGFLVCDVLKVIQKNGKTERREFCDEKNFNSPIIDCSNFCTECIFCGRYSGMVITG